MCYSWKDGGACLNGYYEEIIVIGQKSSLWVVETNAVDMMRQLDWNWM